MSKILRLGMAEVLCSGNSYQVEQRQWNVNFADELKTALLQLSTRGFAEPKLIELRQSKVAWKGSAS